MDKATIDAMRAVVFLMARHSERVDGNNLRAVSIGNSLVSLEEYRRAAEGFLTLVDQAEAKQPQAPAEPDGRDVLERFAESLEDAVTASQEDGIGLILIRSGISRVDEWSLANVCAVIRAIDGLMNAKPTTTGEPTDEECLAAINRNKHKGSDRWKMVVKKHVYLTGVQTLDEDEFIGLGRLLIDRERAEAAKGGA